MRDELHKQMRYWIGSTEPTGNIVKSDHIIRDTDEVYLSQPRASKKGAGILRIARLH